MAPEFLLGPPTPAQLARSGGYSFLDFKLLVSVIGESGEVLGVGLVQSHPTCWLTVTARPFWLTAPWCWQR
jgi:hypothetical protein